MEHKLIKGGCECGCPHVPGLDKLAHDALIQIRANEEAKEGRKNRCVEKCQHPSDFVCDYEDGTLHCLECIAEKFWQIEDILSGKHNVHTYWGALETIAHPERYLTKYDPIEVAKGALRECVCGADRTRNIYCRVHGKVRETEKRS